ncbi:MAG: radical SAM protein [Magnetococcales bacterium]|nr:radical SAM protein [Magnetococcales bacterium]
MQDLPDSVRNAMIGLYVRGSRYALFRDHMPSRLTIFLTDQCNLRCAHCFIVKEDQPKSWEMGLDEYRKLFRSLRGKVKQLQLTGGEPTVRGDFSEVIRLAYTEGKIPSIRLFSNGISTKRLVDLLQDHRHQSQARFTIQTSIDGLHASHDANRGVEGALEKTRATLDALVHLKNQQDGKIDRIIVVTAISSKNLHELPEIIQSVNQNEILHAFTFVRGSEKGVFNLNGSVQPSNFEPADYQGYLTVEQMESARDTIQRELWDKEPERLMYAFNRIGLDIIIKSLKTGTGQIDCKMGYGDLIILSNGDVSRCEMLQSITNLKDHDWNLDNVLRSETFNNFMKSTANCWCTHDCSIGVSMMYEADLLKLLFK